MNSSEVRSLLDQLEYHYCILEDEKEILSKKIETQDICSGDANKGMLGLFCGYYEFGEWRVLVVTSKSSSKLEEYHKANCEHPLLSEIESIQAFEKEQTHYVIQGVREI